jgi:ubiquinone/menaquinone biosynthesis C-methylase UbiE
MPTMSPGTELWAKVAPHWRTYAEYADTRAATITTLLLNRAEIGPGDHVLELACGAGGTGLAAAELVGPSGRVVLSDLVPEMTAIAGDRAAARGLTTVSTEVIDLQRIDRSDGTFDVVLCREGLMFARDPHAALKEIRRVLRPGGRLAIAVWGPRDRNPWLSLVFDTVTAETGQPVPPPGIPGPFALSDADQLRELLAAAGFSDINLTEQSCPLVDRSFTDWWTRTCSLAGPLAVRLAGMTDQQRSALLERARIAIRPYETADGINFPGLALVASARRR